MGELQVLDAHLAALAHVEAGLRLSLGQALEVLSRGGVFALGFSSLAAYVLERGERSARWAEGARCLARRLEALPELRRAVACGEVSWSMAELVARVARPEEEAWWLQATASLTVRKMRQLVQNAATAEREAGRDQAPTHRAVAKQPAANSTADAASADAASADAASGMDIPPAAANEATMASNASAEETEEMCTLVCTVDREEAWLFEATRHLLEHLGERNSNAQVEALLAEGQITLLAALPRGALDIDAVEQLDTRQQRWREQLERWRSEAEERCEERIRAAMPGASSSGAGPNSKSTSPNPATSTAPDVGHVAAAGLAPLQVATARELDETVRALSQALARHELELSQAALRLHRADGWRRLGYATEAQYARERLGVSRSSLIARRSLAMRLEALPQVAEALGTAQLGVEAALQIVRVATALTQGAWIQRAQRRTIKHLREDVAAARMAVRLSGEADCPPPADDEIELLQELERAVLSGTACRGRVAPVSNEALPRTPQVECAAAGPRYAWRAMLQSLSRWLESGVQMSAAPAAAATGRNVASAGRVELRLRVSRSTHTWWRGLEAQARRWLPRGMSWLKFLCLSLWKGWQHLLGTDVAYGQIYLRDRYRCTSPVCSRRDVTPHHLKFRSAGGSDEGDNVAAVCTWCHLFGIHGGRIRAAGPAHNIHWELGAPNDPCLVVDGRERRAA